MGYNSKKNLINELLLKLATKTGITFEFGLYFKDGKEINVDQYLAQTWIKQTGQLITKEQLNTIKLNIQSLSEESKFDFDNVPYKTYQKRLAKTQNTTALKNLKDRYTEYLESISNISNSKQCIYITGASGLGKTTVAKILALKMYSEDEIFISSGGNHPFDEYYGEKVIIIDDFRSSIMAYNDLLRLLDNNTSSNVGARYKNRNLARCELIILTSVLYPHELYLGIEEERYQLYRRLNTYELLKDNESIDLVELKYNKSKGQYLRGMSRDITQSIENYINEQTEINKINVLLKL